MSDFKKFAQFVQLNLKKLTPSTAFTVAVPGDGNGDLLWEHYLASFPEGTNPIFRVRTEHDGSYDKNFIRQVGGLISIEADGSIRTIWGGGDDLPYPYNVVAAAMHEKILELPIKSLFRTKEGVYGHAPNTEPATGLVFQHFHWQVPAELRTDVPDTVRGAWNTNVDTIRRTIGLLGNKAGEDAFNTVLDLIKSNNLYRGSEFKNAVTKAKEQVLKLADQPSSVIWREGGSPLANFKNSSIGSLVCDIASNVPLEEAVRLFESKVAPMNYRRTQAIVTPKMVQQAMEKLNQMGLREALERRHAVLPDLSPNNVLWVNRAAKQLMKDPLIDTLLAGTKKKTGSKGRPGGMISLSDFIEKVLPTAEAIELKVENRHRSNFVVLTAPENPDAPDLFRWDGSIGWSYAGNVTDAITERVKAAGGKTDAPLRFSLAWHNSDDLDLHVTPPNRDRFHEIYFGNKTTTDGKLDVDTNGGCVNNPTDPVENVYLNHLRDGDYKVEVHQYCRRSQSSQGWTLQAAIDNQVVGEWTYEKNTTRVLHINVVDGQLHSPEKAAGQGITFTPGVATPGEFWNVKTEEFSPVETILVSPNHWNKEDGNKHTFFILKGCKCPDNVRAIYNEFLKPELYEHRKVFDLIADKLMVTANENEQLAGIGISETRKANFTVRVTTDGVPAIYEVVN